MSDSRDVLSLLAVFSYDDMMHAMGEGFVCRPGLLSIGVFYDLVRTFRLIVLHKSHIAISRPRRLFS